MKDPFSDFGRVLTIFGVFGGFLKDFEGFFRRILGILWHFWSILEAASRILKDLFSDFRRVLMIFGFLVDS